MMKTAILILGFLFWSYFEFGDLKEFVSFTSNSSFDNNVCFDTDVVLVATNMNKNHCLIKCSLDSTCKSVFYKTENGQCIGCNTAYLSMVDVAEYIGTMYYAIDFKEYGSTCVTEDSCTRANGACWDGTCRCVMGYSFDFKTEKCVTHCERYGSTFQEYLGRTILYLNDVVLKLVTREQCQQLCITDTNCLTFEYILMYQECHTSNATALSNPDSIMRHKQTDLYMRNCEA